MVVGDNVVEGEAEVGEISRVRLEWASSGLPVVVVHCDVCRRAWCVCSNRDGDYLLHIEL